MGRSVAHSILVHALLAPEILIQCNCKFQRWVLIDLDSLLHFVELSNVHMQALTLLYRASLFFTLL